MIVITIARKPLSASTIAANVLEHGTGALNINGSRVATIEVVVTKHQSHQAAFDERKVFGKYQGIAETHQTAGQKLGRWPANVILGHLDACVHVGSRRVKATSIHGSSVAVRRSGVHVEAGGHQTVGREQPVTGYADLDGMETVAAWDCAHGCPVADIDAQTGVLKSGMPSGTRNSASLTFGQVKGNGSPVTGFGDTGGASRYFKQVGGKKS